MALLCLALLLSAPPATSTSGPWVSELVSTRYELARKLYLGGAYERAAVEFEAALDQQPTSARLAYNVARARDRAQQLPAAIAAYELYLRLAPKASDVASIATLVAALRRQMTRSAKPALAILYFDYEGGDAQLRGLRKGFAQMLTSDLSQPTAPFIVVERVRINALLEEQALVQKGIVAPGSAAQQGRLVGAKYLLFGAFFTFGGVARIDAAVVDVETGVSVSVGVAGPPSDMLKLERQLAAKVSTRLAARLCPNCPRAAPPAARPAPARVIAGFGRALDLLDRGELGKARRALSDILSAHPQLPGAQKALRLASHTP